ncbi:hypothetical protein ACTWPT_09740 [Nonomuraea sp. 3N208]
MGRQARILLSGRTAEGSFHRHHKLARAAMPVVVGLDPSPPL